MENIESQFREMLRQNKEDPKILQVYSDWLMSQNDPRGELIGLEIASQSDSTSNFFQAVNRLEELRRQIIKQAFGDAIEPYIDDGIEVVWKYGELIKIKISGSLDMHLPDFFNGLHNLDSVFSLSLNAVDLKLIPDECFENLINVTHLELNRISNLSGKLKNLSNLGSLEISNTHLTGLNAAFIGRFKKLQHLKIDGGGYRVTPKSIFKLKNLTELHLTGNELPVLPDLVVELKKLRVLSLSTISNDIIDLLAQLPDLQVLNVYSARGVSHLHFKKLKSLQALSILNCQLTFLPNYICECLQLKTLNLKYNNIIELPATISQLENLTELILEGNAISLLPDSMGHLHNLKILNIAANKLYELPDSLGELEQLEKLEHRSNFIKELPEKLQSRFRLDRQNI